MNLFRKSFISIALLNDLYTIFIIAPFTGYFIAFAGQFQSQQISSVIIGVMCAAFSAIVINVVYNYIKISRILKFISGDDVERYKAKKMIINFPVEYAGIIVLRWISAITVIIIFLESTIVLSDLQLVVILTVPVFSIPYSISLLSMGAENKIVACLLNIPELIDINIKKDDIIHVNEYIRSLFMVIGIALMPIIIIGFFFILSNNYKIYFANIGIHFTFIIFFTGLAIAATIYEFSKSSQKTIKGIVNAIKHIEKGNLNIEKMYLYSSSELGLVSINVNILVSQLKAILSSIHETTKVILSSSEDINSLAQGLSESANRQASSVEEISASMEQMNSMISQNSDNANTTSEIAKKTAEGSYEGKEIIVNIINAMKQIYAMISTINDIASQTNLLSLNASIEAARAGSHGKGFSVVAAEVRKLAEKSQKASEEISALVNNSSEIVERAGDIFGTILPDIESTADLIQAIAVASQEQKQGVNQVSIGMDLMSEITQQNAASSEELSATADLLNNNLKEMQSVINFFRL